MQGGGLAELNADDQGARRSPASCASGCLRLQWGV